jgi:hypothetical protein
MPGQMPGHDLENPAGTTARPQLSDYAITLPNDPNAVKDYFPIFDFCGKRIDLCKS